ncbi:MAG: SDR family NAD(P)-dependent oxidoreductase [Tractidigestivibacter sp.]|jgi:NAD(P)-dependent dehydrogenase (short-subunit alcohol dehydrogenase family)|uniref:SDR family NAD(P)-dependent oxidoreductase n=1 Tax=Tractidigestivibacter sp. TaxID=2847320 RepID=UPI003D908461
MKDCFDLTGRVALITGASSGLGREFANALASRGADVAILARRKEKLDKVAEEVGAYGHRVLPIVCDVTDHEASAAAVKRAHDELGAIDILINNAGTCDVVPTEEITEERWHKVIDVNLEAVVFMTKATIPYLKESKHGRIISIASMYGLRASVTAPIPAYWASKGAIPQLTRGWAWELAPYGITVNAIAPGFFLSELMPGDDATYQQLVDALIPLKRIGHPEEMDGLVTLLASDGASYITGQTISIDGGKTAI